MLTKKQIAAVRRWVQRNRRRTGLLGGLVAFGIAGVYLVVVPSQTHHAGGLGYVVLRYGHSLCWLLIAAACIAYGLQQKPTLVAGFGYAALAVYALFIAAVLMI